LRSIIILLAVFCAAEVSADDIQVARAHAYVEQAETAWRRMDYRLAYAHAVDALRFDRNNSPANVIAARFAILEMLGPQEWGRTLEKVEGDVQGYVEERATEAIDRLSRALAVDPDHIPARLLLGLVYYEKGMFHRLIGLFEDYRRRMPDRAEPYFMLALALMAQGDDEHATIAFTHGLNRLTPGDPYFDAGFMLGEKPSGPDRQALKVGWAPQDPLKMTSANERLMEHYQRVAYAMLRFSEDPEMSGGVVSDRGRVYVRYGAPKERYIAASSVGPDQLWSYEDFTVSFMRLRGQPWVYRNGIIDRTEFRTMSALAKAFPPKSSVATEWKRFELACRPVQFRAEDGRTRVDFNVSTRESRMNTSRGPKGARRVEIEHALVVMLLDWTSAERHVENLEYMAWLHGDREGGYLVRTDHVILDSGVYRFTVESLDRKNASVGVYVDTVEVRNFVGSELLLSDIALNRRSLLRPGHDGREDAVFLAAPEGIGVRGKSLEAYAEVYNLKPSVTDSVRYSTVFFVQAADPPGEWVRVSATTTKAVSPRQTITLKLDLDQTAPGPKRMRLRVTDHERSETIERMADFRVTW